MIQFGVAAAKWIVAAAGHGAQDRAPIPADKPRQFIEVDVVVREAQRVQGTERRRAKLFVRLRGHTCGEFNSVVGPNMAHVKDIRIPSLVTPKSVFCFVVSG